MSKVSIIIPCYNLGEYLDEAVNSVLAQTYQDFEIIIVNDGSTDSFTNNLLTNYNKPKTKVLVTENQGLPSARNNGIRVSSGEYICCLDADDRYHPEFLEKTISILEKDNLHELGMVTSWIQTFGEQTELWKPGISNPFKLATENMLHVASLFRRECWEKVGGYATDLTGYQDWNFWISIAAKGYKWTSVQEGLFFYRIRKNSMVTGSNKKRDILYNTIIDNNKDFYIKNINSILLEFSKSNQRLDEMQKEIILDRDQKWILIKRLQDELRSSREELQSIKSSRAYQLSLLLRTMIKSKRSLFEFPIRLFLFLLPFDFKKSLKHFLKSLNLKKVRFINSQWSDKPLVSVIIPCYNYGRFIEEAIDSVLNQTFMNFEIIVVDDGSTDPFTKEVLNKLNKPKTRVIFQHNQKLPATRNNGIELAEGKYICCLDADDLLKPTYLEKCVLKMEYYNLDICYSYIEEFEDSNNIWPTGEFSLKNLMNHNCVCVASVFKKEIWQKSGGYNPKMIHGYEDWEFWINIAKHGAIGDIVPEPLFLYRKHGRSMIDDAEEKHQFLLNFIRENHKDIFNDRNLLQKAIKRQRIKFLVENMNVNLYDNQSGRESNILFITSSFRMCENGTLTKVRKLSEDKNILFVGLSSYHNDSLSVINESTTQTYYLEGFIEREYWIQFLKYLIISRNINTIILNKCDDIFSLLKKEERLSNIRYINF
jgi:glycosyltransferase involved in cell wall biosynthesis